jgi:hypothetical protein
MINQSLINQQELRWFLPSAAWQHGFQHRRRQGIGKPGAGDFLGRT